jgi:iron(III)-enterobactin esterase
MKNQRSLVLAVALFCLVAAAHPTFGADAIPSPAPAAAPAPSAGSPATVLHFSRGRPATPADLAEMAPLASLPALAPGAGEGDYLVRPPYAPAPEEKPQADVPEGKVVEFMLAASDSKFYPGTGMRGAVAARRVTVYIPSQYVPGTPAPLLVTQDAMGARDRQLPTILDNLIAAHRVPALVAVMVGNGGGDARGSERGLEYDTVSGKFAEFIEAEVLPRVARDYGVAFTRDPDGRATLGGSSGGAAAFTMAWFHPGLYRRVLTYSGTYTNNQSEVNPALPHGAWEYHEHLVPESAPKPLRIWMEVGEKDNGSTNTAADFHNWVIANERMAGVLKAKGYHYQFVYAVGAGHVDRRVVAQTLPQALEWLWKGYKPENWQAASNSPTSKRTALTTSETEAATWGESSRHIGLIVSTEIANR